MTKPAGTWAPACPVFPHPQSCRHPSGLLRVVVWCPAVSGHRRVRFCCSLNWVQTVTYGLWSCVCVCPCACPERVRGTSSLRSPGSSSRSWPPPVLRPPLGTAPSSQEASLVPW